MAQLAALGLHDCPGGSNQGPFTTRSWQHVFLYKMSEGAR